MGGDRSEEPSLLKPSGKLFTATAGSICDRQKGKPKGMEAEKETKNRTVWAARERVRARERKREREAERVQG